MLMNVGWLYFLDDPKLSLLQKIQRAQEAFERKFEHKADFCQLNIGDAENEDLEAISKSTRLTIKAEKMINPHNFFVGYEGIDVRERA
jgi:hypothetical protein